MTLGTDEWIDREKEGWAEKGSQVGREGERKIGAGGRRWRGRRMEGEL